MSVDDYSDDDDQTRPPKGQNFSADLTRVGEVMEAALRRADDDENMDPVDLQESAVETATDLENFLVENDVPREEAIAAAWMFLLSFAD